MKNFKEFVNEDKFIPDGYPTIEQQKFLNSKIGDRWSFNKKTKKIDVLNGGVDISESELNDLHDIEFGDVTGTFTASRNNLKSFKGFPIKCKYLFTSSNKFNTLEGFPALTKYGGRFFFMNGGVREETMDKLLEVFMKNNRNWIDALVICRNEIPIYEWNLLDKPADEELEKYRHEHRGRIETKKFGI